MTRRACRIDGNHREIRDGLRDLHVRVHDTSRLGGGFPDLQAWKYGRHVWLECKMPKGGRLTPAQEKWHAEAKAAGEPVFIVHSLDEALDALGVQILSRVSGRGSK